jgi:hypothetical protein
MQVPDHLISPGDFKVVEKFLIPKVQLCDRILSMCVPNTCMHMGRVPGR